MISRQLATGLIHFAFRLNLISCHLYYVIDSIWFRYPFSQFVNLSRNSLLQIAIYGMKTAMARNIFHLRLASKLWDASTIY